MTETRQLDPPAGVAMSSTNPRTDDELIRDVMQVLGAVLDRASIYAVMSDREGLDEPEDAEAAPLMAQQGCVFVAQVQALVNEFVDGPSKTRGGYSEHLISLDDGDSLFNGFAGYARSVARAAADETLRPFRSRGEES